MSFQSITFLSMCPTSSFFRVFSPPFSALLLQKGCSNLCLPLKTGFLIFNHSHRCEWEGNQEVCEQGIKVSIPSCGEGKSSHTKAKKGCCPCRWGYRIAAFECLGYAELYIWAGWLGLGWEGWSVCMHRSNGIELGSGFVLLFMDSDVCI